MERKHASHTFQLSSDDDSNLCMLLCVFVYFTAHNLESKCWKTAQGIILIKKLSKLPKGEDNHNFHPFITISHFLYYYAIKRCSIVRFSISPKHNEYILVWCISSVLRICSHQERFYKGLNLLNRKWFDKRLLLKFWSFGRTAALSLSADGNCLIARRCCNKGNSIGPCGMELHLVPNIALYLLTCTTLLQRCLASHSWLVWR